MKGKAQEWANEYKQKEMERVFKKEKDTRTWAWHVAYYKRQLKDLQKQIKYYEERLDYGRTKVSRNSD